MFDLESHNNLHLLLSTIDRLTQNSVDVRLFGNDPIVSQYYELNLDCCQGLMALSQEPSLSFCSHFSSAAGYVRLRTDLSVHRLERSLSREGVSM